MSIRSVLLVLMLAGSMKAMNVELICLEKTDLADKIAKKLDKPLHTPMYRQFADGELNVVLENYQQYTDKTVVIIQSTNKPVNEHILGVAFCAHELKNAGAKKVIAVVPYFGYTRQERSKIENKPGHAAVIAQLFEGAGIDEVVAVELHDLAIIDLFSIPVHNVLVNHIIAQHVQHHFKLLQDICLIAPDKGAREYVDDIADELNVETLTFSKERYGPDKTRVIKHEGECGGNIGIMVDDIMSTGGTAINVCNALAKKGFRQMYGYFVHPVLAGNAVERVEESYFDKIFVGNTIPLSAEAQKADFIEVFDVSEPIVTTLNELLS